MLERRAENLRTRFPVGDALFYEKLLEGGAIFTLNGPLIFWARRPVMRYEIALSGSCRSTLQTIVTSWPSLDHCAANAFAAVSRNSLNLLERSDLFAGARVG